MSNVQVRRALISVSDKSNLEPLVKKLSAQGVEIISSGGTGKAIAAMGVDVTPVEHVTGNPEAFGGRMKTLSFEISSALLYRRDEQGDICQAKELGIAPIDLVVCNLYPFEQTAKRSDDWSEIVENIDIGGPSMIRAAAKNYQHVGVAVDPQQYDLIIRDLEDNDGALSAQTRESLACAAFRHTARYDGLIAAQFEKRLTEDTKTLTLSPDTAHALRYGENPHQKAWVYADAFHPGLAGATPLQGKALSYNNLLDADAAWRVCGDIAAVDMPDYPAAVSIIKHLSPCGVARAGSLIDALELAWAGDPVSSFGGILCFNATVEDDIANWLADKFVEVVIAPSFSDAARARFAKKKNLRVIALPTYDGTYDPPVVRSVSGGWLVQQEDTGPDTDFRSVTQKNFPQEKLGLAHFGIMASKHLKSNAIGLFSAHKSGISMIGAGMGNPNRLVSMKQAIEKARENGHDDISESVLISDAFFPFPDNIDVARQGGARYIVQPGGSIKDDDVIAACDDADIAMAFTGRRHFRH